MTDARRRLAELREEGAALLAELDGALPRVEPVRMDDNGCGIAMRVWFDSPVVEVHTCPAVPDDGEGPLPASVYLMGRRLMSWDPDWSSLTPGEARALGLALLSAANDAGGPPRPDELARRRPPG